MGSNVRRMNYEVDLVFCVDVTLSMDHILDIVKNNALNFYRDFKKVMDAKGKKVNQLRVRIVAFRDYYYDNEKAMLQTDFFTLPDMAEDFEDCVKSLIANGGGDDPEDGLEALAYAIKSNWSDSLSKKRQVIVVWSDEGTHDLGFGSSSPYYPPNMVKDFNELTEMWGSKKHPGMMDENAKRLVLFAPDKPGWSTIRNNWNNVVHFITEDEDLGLTKVDYEEILDVITNSI